MKKLYLPFLAIMLPFVANAQLGIFSEPLDTATPVDTAAYKVTYALDYTCHPLVNNRFSDVRNVLIGRHTVKDFSDIIFQFDSLCTADIKKGKDVFSNPNGTPWPVETLLAIKERRADMKRRLPSGTGILCYSEQVPSMEWEFVADSVKNILGYECFLARTEFFGRNYSAWYTFELPLPFGPYKFGGLPGMIVQIQDDEGQFIWVMKGFERVKEPIYVYEYPNEKKCSSDDADKTVKRYYNTPIAFHLAAIGGGTGRLMIVGKDGKVRDATEVEETPIPYKPLEIR